MVKKLGFFSFSKFSDYVELCAVLILGQGNGVEEGVLVQPCWQHCSAAPTLKLEESLIPGWKHYSHF